ncbi:MAG: LysR family transcriptional regulator, partial [Variovorax sp.]
ITQPALSNALRALEAEFGVVIVKRGRAYAGLTHEGEAVLVQRRQVAHRREQVHAVWTLAATAIAPIPGTPRNRLCRAAGVAPGEGVGGHTKWANLGVSLMCSC